jgi:ubiquinone/menaquinone biosynthesis C-methylase UbiE
MFKHTMERERAFERNHISTQQQVYLETDVLEKVAEDDGYRKKVGLIEQALAGERGWILDVGSGTCGEDEYLATKGLRLICADVNDLALALSKQRSERFNRDNLKYVACDGQQLPFIDDTISFVIFNESLHHLPNPAKGLSEASRVLKPGGRIFMFEPYAYNPWRRISEVRDRIKGTIEKSFSMRSIRNLCNQANLSITKIERTTYISATKLERLSSIHRAARVTYHKISEAIPSIFGMILLTAKKGGGQVKMTSRDVEFEDLLRCPASMSRLKRVADGYLAIDDPQRRFYPVKSDIPLLLISDSQLLSEAAFNSLLL